MVERTRGLDIACHLLLILGGLLVCVPIWFAFVVGSHTAADVLTVPPPWYSGAPFRNVSRSPISAPVPKGAYILWADIAT